MAKFSFNGVDAISASFEELTRLSEEEKLSIIRPSAELLVSRHAQKIRSLFVQRSGALAGSLSISEQCDGAPRMHIYLKGKHPGSSTGKRKRKNGRSNGKYSGTNAEVGYILEYGSPRIKATHWMETTNEESEDAIAASQQEAFNDLLKKKGF